VSNGDDDSLPLLVVTTLASREQALALAREMVERRLAACAQVNAIDNVYRWQGQVAQDTEFRLLLKTRPALYPRLEAALRERHPYALPDIHAIATAQADAAYAAWVRDSCDG